ncbi:hypothetical protein VTJ04DRAFT_9745 [Mycothermus thermophilus]|uniref:uncharacterized protein n=1 Tax=Humicola insolens TaxID=85995 RepID=UPI00374357C5
MPSPLAIAAIILAVVYAGIRGLLHLTQHPEEPPAVLFTIPFLSPILGLLKRRYKLWLDILHQYKLPIYTIRLPFLRLYVINDPALITRVERQPRIIAFAPLEANATGEVLGMSGEAKRILKKDPTGPDGHFITFHQQVRPVLSPGPALDEMNRRSVQSLASSLESLRMKGSTVVELFDWVRHEIVMATTDAEYGVHNPFRDPEFERMWDVFESHLPLLSTGNFLPSLLSPSAVQAREFLPSRMSAYFSAGHHLPNHHGCSSEANCPGGSPFLHARLAHGRTRGMPLADQARGELGACIAMINNTVGAAFWVLYHVFSDERLLSEIRREIEAGVTITGQEEKTTTKTLDLAHVKYNCPLLLSTLEEVFRFRGIAISLVRRVEQDFRLDNKWLVKKGGIVVMPYAAQHFGSRWGDGDGKFDPYRFLKRGPGKGKKASGFRIFGGGVTRCPGREYAVTEVLALVGLVVAMFDVRPVDGGWKEVGMKAEVVEVSHVFPMPEGEVKVEVRPREIGKEERWRVVLSESKRVVYVSEDEEGRKEEKTLETV